VVRKRRNVKYKKKVGMGNGRKKERKRNVGRENHGKKNKQVHSKMVTVLTL
jgi:hypothetical protein